MLDEQDDRHVGAEDVVGGDLHGLETAHSPALITIGGGAPLRASGQLVGAVGVSGGTPAQDHELAVELAQLYEAGDL